jgi:hypothetical protein
MQTITLPVKYFAALRAGTKTCTVVPGTTHIVPGALLINSTPAGEQITVTVHRVSTVHLKDLNQSDATMDECATPAVLITALKVLHPLLNDNSLVSVIQF